MVRAIVVNDANPLAAYLVISGPDAVVPLCIGICLPVPMGIVVVSPRVGILRERCSLFAHGAVLSFS